MIHPRTTIMRIRRLMVSPVALNLLYVPALALFVLFVFYPLIQGLKLSFTDWNGYLPRYNWVGLRKYAEIFKDPRTSRTVINTLVYGVGSTLFENVVGLAYALLLNSRIRGKGFVRTVVYFPIVISPLIIGYIFYFIFQYEGGALNDIVMWLGHERLDLLGDARLARWVIVGVDTYQYVGIAMLILLAGLQSIPREVFEAASIDGASAVDRFRYVTLPLLAPAITISVVINLIYGLKLFDVVKALTAGGPAYTSHSLSTSMYDVFFGHQDGGMAAALGVLTFLLISAISIGVLMVLRRREVEL